MLTDGTRADSVPNLEIETGDIVGAGHASATGRFDDEQLFYLQSRGITEDEARRLVVRGFLAEIVQQIGVARAPGAPAGRDRGGARSRRGSRHERAVRICAGSTSSSVEPGRARRHRRHADRRREGFRRRAVHAIGDTCTHGDISLSEGFVEDETLECWAHGSQFSLRTGKPLTLPAYEPVPVYTGRDRRRRRLHRPDRLQQREEIRSMSVLEIKDLHVSVETDQGTKQILKGVDLTINEGEIHADHGAERLRQVHPRVHDRRPPQVPRRERLDHARRRGRARDDRRRARPRRPVPRDAVPGRDPRRDRHQLPPHRQDRDRRRGARHPRLDQGRHASR